MASSSASSSTPTAASPPLRHDGDIASLQPDPAAHRTGPDCILIPISQVGKRSTTLSDTSSLRSDFTASSSSSSSSLSFLPTFRSIQRSHFFQFCATLLFLFIVPLVILIGYKREFRSDAFAIGVAAWLASETLRQVVFDLLTPARRQVPTAEYENLVLDDDPPDVASQRQQQQEVEDEDDPPPPRFSHGSAAIPTLVYSIAQEALRLGAVAIIVRLLPTEVPVAASSLLLETASRSSSLYNSSHRHPLSLIPPPPPSHPAPPSHPEPPSGGGLPPLDPLFWSALWLALGWAGAEILWGSKRLWNQLELYRDVLPLYPSSEEEEEAAQGGRVIRDERDVLLGVPTAREERGYGAVNETEGRDQPPNRPHTGNGTSEEHSRWRGPADDPDAEGTERGFAEEEQGNVEDDEEEEEADFQYRVREAQRDELEEQLGVPLYEVPVGIIFIWRLDSLLLSLVFTLFLALPFRLSPPSLFHFPLYPTFALVCLTHALLSYAWVARVRKIGIPSISYASLIVLVALTFAALGSWGVLV
ncbi:hypothetical protein JCM10908_007183 [Rhodotorula pacifica]|uniref:uncharacterized protein n=1 Tax=Rhodotorula pacifica TaxID=1495444 RepID=UPI00317D1291